MLAKLQEIAIPVPIRVACTYTPKEKPDYLGVEYHGHLSQGDEMKLLEGKCGRFIIRDNRTATCDHGYTIVFNYMSEIFTMKIVYDPTTRMFETEPPSQNQYKTVLLLMTDVLLYHHNDEGRGFNGIRRRSSTRSNGNERSHNFQLHTYLHPKWCDHCNEFIWGIHNQGFRCKDCSTAVHKFCRYMVDRPCGLKLKFSTSFDVSESEINPCTKKKVILPNFQNKCQYFRECSQFLSAYKIRDVYIDMGHPQTQCFCTPCMNKKQANCGESAPPLYYTNWTSHTFANQEDSSKRNVKNWDIAYFPIKAKYLLKMIQECFEPAADDTDIDLLVSKAFEQKSQDLVRKRYSHKFVDSKTGCYSYAHILLQIYIKPGSYHAVTLSNGVIRMMENCDFRSLLCVKKREFIYPKSILIKITSECENEQTS